MTCSNVFRRPLWRKRLASNVFARWRVPAITLPPSAKRRSTSPTTPTASLAKKPRRLEPDADRRGEIRGDDGTRSLGRSRAGGRGVRGLRGRFEPRLGGEQELDERRLDERRLRQRRDAARPNARRAADPRRRGVRDLR